MGKTIAEKILSEKSGTDARAGQIVMANVDYVMVNDVTGPIAFREYSKLGTDKMYKDRMVLIPDHYVPAKDVASAEQAKEMREFAHQHELPNYFEIGKSGVCHQLMVEEGFAAPGRLIVGADSHTCTYGGINAFSTGIGSTEAAAAFATGKLWFKVPETIKVVVKGKFRKYVGGKDLILRIITDIGVDGANYKAFEFHGDIQNIPVADRLAVSNMAIEAGGKAGIFPWSRPIRMPSTAASWSTTWMSSSPSCRIRTFPATDVRSGRPTSGSTRHTSGAAPTAGSRT